MVENATLAPGALQKQAVQPTTHCARCGAGMSCNPGPDCWCVQVPFQPMPENATACLCPSCLDEAIKDRA